MTQIHPPQHVVDARIKARDVLIGYISEPPTETDENLRQAVQALADEMGVSYEAAFRYLLVGSV